MIESELEDLLDRELGFHDDITERTNKKNVQNTDFIEATSKEIMNRYKLVTVQENKTILCYDNGVYIAGGEILIEKECERILEYNLTNRILCEVKGHIMRNTYRSVKEFDSDINIINMTNGLYNISKNRLLDHTPDYLTINQIKVIYDAKAKPKVLGKFLSEVLYPSEIRTLIELFAYTFHRDNPFEIITTLLGYGSNGKSVLLGLLTSLHGTNNISNVSLKSILTNRFALSDLENKTVNIDTELSSTTIEDAAILKKLTGKQPIRIERKNEKAYDTRLYAKLFFNANKIPETKDDSDAYYRRNIIVSLPNQFEEVKSETSLKIADPYILDKLTSEDELSGIFIVLMNALRMLLKNKRIYVNDKTIQQRREKYQIALDPVKMFLDDAVAEDSTEFDTITKEELYVAYTMFCKAHHLAVLKKEKFGSMVKRSYSDGRQGGGKRQTIWKGVSLNKKYHRDPLQQTLSVSTSGSS